jgi:NDP-sugar pyrophosphorylase family protein
MKALILAAGEGTRLRPLTLTQPKPMLPIGGVPILEHLVGHLRQHGIDEVAINLHYKPEAITTHFGDGLRFGVRVVYSSEPQLLGSAGAARALDWFLDDTFLVLYGDVLTDIDLSELVRRHRVTRAAATLALYEVEDKTRCGMVDTDATGRIERFLEKPAANVPCGDLANAGIYVLEPGVLQRVPRGENVDFGLHVFPQLLASGVPMYGYRIDGYILDIGSPARYAQAESDLRSGRFRSSAAAEPALAAGGIL